MVEEMIKKKTTLDKLKDVLKDLDELKVSELTTEDIHHTLFKLRSRIDDYLNLIDPKKQKKIGFNYLRWGEDDKTVG